MTTPTHRRRIIASLTAATVIGGGTWAFAANPAPESFAFVARGDNPVDALAAAPLAGRLDAPVVLTEPTVLTEAARRSLLDADPDTVWIAGGTGAISLEVEAAIEDLLPAADVERASGETRYHTAERLAALFDDVAPSFLARDGKANAADRADVASDAEKLGGLAPGQYQFTEVNRQGEFQEFTFSGMEQTSKDILPPMTIDVPADGLLQVDGLAIDDNGVADGFLALLDYTGPVDTSDDAALIEVYDKLVLLSSSGSGGMIRVPQRVTAGEHTIRFVALGSDGVAEIGLRSLSVHYTSGADGPWEDFTMPPSPSPAAPAESGTLREMLVGADD